MPRAASQPDASLSPAALRAALDVTAEAVCFIEAGSLRVLDANRAAVRLLGYSLDQLRGLTLPELAPTLELEGSLAKEADAPQTVLCRHSDGSTFPARARLGRVADEERDLVLIALQALETEDEQAGGPLDELTGLPTRRAFERRLAEAVERASAGGPPFAVLFVDVDYFKQANDQLGHLAGDQVLRAVADRLAHCLRPNDLVARFGGDEFVALLYDVRDADAAAHIAERIIRQIEPPIALDAADASVTASIGVALGGPPLLDSQAILRAADQAMYEAKRRGRNGFAVAGTS
jgi:diguanylate cyclase (GGDEF)-like protein/PAS domain S-box-containing protein